MKSNLAFRGSFVRETACGAEKRLQETAKRICYDFTRNVAENMSLD
jgi:hypothetical protein